MAIFFLCNFKFLLAWINDKQFDPTSSKTTEWEPQGASHAAKGTLAANHWRKWHLRIRMQQNYRKCHPSIKSGRKIIREHCSVQYEHK